MEREFELIRPVVVPRPRVSIVGQQALVAYLEGRPSIDPADRMYGLHRKAIEVWQKRRSHVLDRELRGMLRRGEVSRFQLERAFRTT